MTISSTISRKEYSGNDVTTAFSFPYYFLANADLVVIITVNSTGAETVQVLDTDFTVSGAGNPSGGTVTMMSAPATGETLTIYRDPAVTQEADYTEGDPFPSETHEEVADRLTMIGQRNRNLVDRAMRLPNGEADLDMALPAKVDRAGKVLGFDANGQPVASETDLEDFDGIAEQVATDAATASAAASTATSAASTASSAATSAGSAQTAAEAAQTAAEAAETDAEAAQTAAEAAQTAAEAAQSAAETAESNAEGSATSAASSASTASDAETNVLAAYDDFDARYLGAKSSNPATDNDGGALATGALYFNTSSNEMRAYTGSTWVVAAAPSAGTVPDTREVNAGTGLEGGGDLSTDRTIGIADGGVDTDQIADSAINQAKLASTSVNTAKLTNGAVTEGKLQDGAVATAKIADDAVTFAKLQNATGESIIGATAAGAFIELGIGDGLEIDGTDLKVSAGSDRYVSTGTALDTAIAAGVKSGTHGLGGTPIEFGAYIECTHASGDNGYSQGDRLTSDGGIQNSNEPPWCQMSCDGTVVRAELGDSVRTIPKGGGSFVGLTESRWEIVVWARL